MDPMLVLTVCNHCKLLCIKAQDFILLVLQKVFAMSRMHSKLMEVIGPKQSVTKIIMCS